MLDIIYVPPKIGRLWNLIGIGGIARIHGIEIFIYIFEYFFQKFVSG